MGGDERDVDDAVSEQAVGRRPVAGIAVVLAVGVASFGITAAARGGDSAGENAEPIPAESTAPDGTSAPTGDEPVPPVAGDRAPIVTEVELAVLAPIDADVDGVPLPPPDAWEGPGSIDEVVSPVVGTAIVGVGDDADDRGLAGPPALSAVFGAPPPDDVLTAPSLDADLDEVGPVEPTPLPDDVDTEELLDLIGDLAEEYDAEAATETAGSIGADASDGGPSGGGVPDAGSATDDVPRLADPCADDADPDRCPDPGEPGTIIETFALTVPPRLSVRVQIPGELCGPTETTQFEHRIAIESTTPLTSFEMTFWRLGWPTGEYRQTVSLSTPAAEAEAWMDAFAASTDEPPPPIVHCTTLTDLRPDWAFQYRAEALDTFDRVWNSYGLPTFPGPTALLPPTFVLRLDDNEILVSAPKRDDQSIAVLAFRRDGSPMEFPVDPCASTSRFADGFENASQPLEPSVVPVSLVNLRNAGFNTSYRQRYLAPMRLDEGSSYRLCIHWSTTRPSFSTGLTRTLAYDIETPDALSMTFEVVRVEAEGSGGIRERALSVDVAPAGRGLMVGYPWCGRWQNTEQLEGDNEIDETICRSDPLSSDLFGRGARVSMFASGVDGVRRQSSAIIPIRTCRMPCVIPEPETFRLELPTGRTSYDFWCGLFGDECESANEEESFGTITIRVSYDNDGGTLRSGWGVAEPQEFGDQRPPPAETPRLDTFATPTVSGDPTRPTLTVPVLADRPVTASVELRAGAGEVCRLDGGPTTASSDELSTTHEFVFDEMCLEQSILPIVELTDAEGRTSRWHGAFDDPRWPDGELWLRGFAHIPVFFVELAAEASVTVPTRQVRFRQFDLTVSGREIRWDRWIATSSPTGCRTPAGLPTTVRNQDARTPGRGLALVPTGRSIDIGFTVEAELLVPTCADAVSSQPEPFTVAQSIDWDDVAIDEPIVVTGRLAVPELGPDAFIDVSATVTIRRGPR